MKKAVPILKKVILVLFLLSLCVAGLCAYAMFGSNTADTDDISYYRALTGEIDGASLTPILGQSAYKTFLDLPALTELESYIDYRFNFTVRRYGLFRSHSAILVVRYSDEGYTEEKMKLSQKYTYLSEKIWGGGVVCDHSPVFSMDNFGFHAIEVAPDNYPKTMFFIGASDERKEIAYIYFQDRDLDYISPSLQVFLMEETGWSKVAQ